jgi:single-strand DNA-binding protein
MNKVILSGNLCQDIELMKTNTGKSVVSNSVAVQREYKNPSGGYDTDFINIVVWGTQAEYLSRYAAKGDRVELCGRWTVRKYTANDGTTRTVNECVVESIKAFSRQQKNESTEPTAPTTANFEEIGTDEELPF